MKQRHSRASQPLTISATPKAFLAAALSLACVFTLGIDLPSTSAAPPANKHNNPKNDPVLKGLPITELSEDEAILHALNRLAFGPRPGDIERVRQIGLAKWIDQQLNPDSIDDKALDARLANYPTLKMSTSQLIAEYPQPKPAERQAAKRAQAQLEATQQQTRGDAAAAVVARDMQKTPPSTETSPTETENAATASSATDASANSSSAAAAGSSSPDANAPSPMKDQPAPENAPARAARRAQRNNAFGEDSRRPQRIIAELAMAKVTRAIYSQRQLQQVMDDFWFNHFNVFAAKGEDRYYLTAYERDVIQPHTLGKFKDLLFADAKSPAMLFYLDNFLSVDPRSAQRIAQERYARQMARYRGFGPPPPPPQARRKGQNERGLNENYGRELMELHTLGVDGGYTQKDVTEVARCFTGWTIDRPRISPQFKFDDRLHDPDPKIVLGKKIHAGGMRDGEEVIDLLAHSPSTAKFISTELARRFVSDNPPPALVAHMSQTFLSSSGDIRSVMRAMIYSPEFWSREAYRAKIKSPFELVVSAARALGTDVDMAQPLVGWIARIGEPLYHCQPPTGYSDKAETWVNTGALLNRLNFSLALAGNRVRGSRSDVAALLGTDAETDAKSALENAVKVFLGGQASPTTVETLQKQLDNPQVLQARLDDPVKEVNLGVVAGLVLGAPEFQRR